MHKINEMLDEDEGKTKEKCTSKCRYYNKNFEHTGRACVLSDVYSVKMSEPCSTFEEIKYSVTADME